MLRMIRWARGEAQAFRAALAAAPEPNIGWDFLGVRRLAGKTWWLLLHEHTSPARLAAAVLIGIMIGVSPFYGFHILLTLMLAWLLRLNKLVVWLGSNISIPFISPFFAVVSIEIGSWLLSGRFLVLTREEFEAMELRDIFLYWLLGFPVVGLAVGGSLACIVYLVARRRQSRLSETEPR